MKSKNADLMVNKVDLLKKRSDYINELRSLKSALKLLKRYPISWLIKANIWILEQRLKRC